jgi:hypothetical protein
MQIVAMVGILLALALAVFVVTQMALVTVNAFLGHAPFVPVPRRRVGPIIEALRLGPGSVLFDLGSGDGRIVVAAAGREPACQAIGVERSLLPLCMAYIRRWKAGVRKNSRFIKQDLYTVSLRDATHVYCYLFHSMMERLEKKFERELAPGTRVVACAIPLPTRTPVEIIELGGGGLGARLYVYEY